MPLSPAPLPGLAAARQATRRTWLVLAIVALVPGWAAAQAMGGFATIGAQTLSKDAPNVWSIVARLPWLGALPLAGLAMASAIGAAAWLAAHFSARPPRDALAAALLIALVVPGLLPGMTPVDFLLAGLLSVALSARDRDRASLSIAATIGAGLALASADLAPLGAAPMIVVTALVAQRFFLSPANDNGLPLNPLAELPG
ncbi:hypothetical protein [Sphingomonas sp.]|jgi:hypothetical protein|uniref:hypothetical protein n=1 Tax=Sphingomonas sp. TaxID=28214 RepID=UPI002E35FD2B|nr:hypothetical protein [Sphingomonas sp.]HEX4693069.1 hypothetical protein [Sphingomonas sp.]